MQLPRIITRTSWEVRSRGIMARLYLETLGKKRYNAKKELNVKRNEW